MPGAISFKAKQTAPEDQDLDRIICPVLAAGVKHKVLPLDEGGSFDKAGLHAFISDALSLGPALVEAFSPLFFAEGPLVPVFEMDGHHLEHGVSSGIRDPAPPNRTQFDKLISFAEDGHLLSHMGHFELEEAGKYFDAHPTKGDDFNANKSGAEVAFVNFLLPIFGRCGDSAEVRNVFNIVRAPVPYPPNATHTSFQLDGTADTIDCTSDHNVFMTIDDLEQLFMYNNFPEGFILNTTAAAEAAPAATGGGWSWAGDPAPAWAWMFPPAPMPVSPKPAQWWPWVPWPAWIGPGWMNPWLKPTAAKETGKRIL